MVPGTIRLSTRAHYFICLLRSSPPTAPSAAARQYRLLENQINELTQRKGDAFNVLKGLLDASGSHYFRVPLILAPQQAGKLRCQIASKTLPGRPSWKVVEALLTSFGVTKDKVDGAIEGAKISGTTHVQPVVTYPKTDKACKEPRLWAATLPPSGGKASYIESLWCGVSRATEWLRDFLPGGGAIRPDEANEEDDDPLEKDEEDDLPSEEGSGAGAMPVAPRVEGAPSARRRAASAVRGSAVAVNSW
jgi:hypothetical protein